MRISILPQAVFLVLFSLIFSSLPAQSVSEKVKGEITEALKIWNAAAKSGNVEKCISLFDNTDDVMLVGSDKGEICKGKEQLRAWLSAIFAHANFSWEMKTIDIDANGKTAWVFVNGTMIIQWDTGQTKRTPYRFTGIMVRKHNTWKWRLFNGSIPRGE